MVEEAAVDIEATVRAIDGRLEHLLPKAREDQEPLGAALADSVLAPGKRLRPLMTVLAAEDLGGSRAAAIDAGCAIEMVHAASLVLDDLPSMDDAQMRRGRPAVHRAHGEDVAVLAAIAALSEAYGVIAAIPDLSPEQRLECVRLLASAIGTNGLVGGQYHDLRGGRGPRAMTEIAAANGLKTGSLFVAALGMGCAVAGAGEPTRRELDAFAREIGLAFQLLDDLLDAGSSPQLLGKDVGKDAGRSTIVSLIGPVSSERHVERHVESAHMHLTTVFGARSRMAGLVDRIFRPLAAAGYGARQGLEREAGAV